MVSTEGVTGIQPQAAENLALKVPMVIPKEIEELEDAGQLPAGGIVYFDIADPELRPVDRTTWRPIMKARKEKRLNPNRIPKTFAAIILHTPARTPDNSYEDIINKLSTLLMRSMQKDENGVTTGQKLGTLFIVEDRGEDTGIGWRQDKLAIKGKKGLVVDTTHEGSVTVTDSYILSYARRKMQQSVKDLGTSRAGPMEEPFIQKLTTNAERQGFTIDTTRIRKRFHATKYPPGAIAALKDGNGAIYTTMNADGKQITVDVSEDGITTVYPSQEALKEYLREGQAEEKKIIKIEHKEGDIVETQVPCYECGGHYREEYYPQADKVNMLLKRDLVCHGAHSDGRPNYYGERGVEIRILERLPKTTKKPRK